DRLLDAVVEDTEILATKAFHKVTAGVGNDDANVDAINANTNSGRLMGCGLLRAQGGNNKECRQAQAKPNAARDAHALNLIEPLFEVKALGVFPGCSRGGMQMARKDLRVDFFEPSGDSPR